MTELDALLEKAGKLGFMVHAFRADQHGPDVLAAAYQWEFCADVVVLVDDQRAHAYRVPTWDGVDVFAPTQVCWWYRGSAVWTLRALLTLPDPGHPDSPGTLVPAPPGTGVTGDRVPVRMRRRAAPNRVVGTC
jgi:hypothetical protein